MGHDTLGIGKETELARRIASVLWKPGGVLVGMHFRRWAGHKTHVCSWAMINMGGNFLSSQEVLQRVFGHSSATSDISSLLARTGST